MPKSFYLENLNSDIEKLFHDAVNVLEGLGAEVVEIDVPGASELQAWATILIYSDACAFHHDRLKNNKEKFSAQVYERMITGWSYTNVDYSNAMHARELWQRDLAKVFADVDIILSPTLPTLIPPVEEEKSLLEATKDATRNTYAGAFGKLPGLTIPCGFTSDGLPAGLQLEASWWNEPLLLKVGAAFQRVTNWHTYKPKMARI